jgi:ribosomal protein S18 acetylase RimI-like enzyme
LLSHHAAASNTHVIDLPYRLSSWAFDYPENIALWEQDGRLVAWAALLLPFWCIDYACDPAVEPGLHRDVLSWADARAKQVVGTDQGRPLWFVDVMRHQTGRIRDLEALGFVNQEHAPEEPYSKVILSRPSTLPVPDEPLPDGFTIRPLAGATEAEAYVALHREAFQSKNMTVEWRLRTLARPEYVPELDLVAVAPDGRLAAFCITWFDPNYPDGPAGQVEPLGVGEAHRQLGLGRAVLLEGLRRLYGRGARQVLVETDSFRDGAIRLYEAAGFERKHDILVFRKDYAT